jgi:hypothetical protein
MHQNAALLSRLFTALDQHDHTTMASCYHPDATFRDIAFDLAGQRRIHAMWHMVSESDIRVAVEHVEAGEREGYARFVDTYTFGAGRGSGRPGRLVRNPIEARFWFEGEQIIRELDSCDARAWASAALGGASGFLAGRVRLLRSAVARSKLDAFIERHPEYR